MNPLDFFKNKNPRYSSDDLVMDLTEKESEYAEKITMDEKNRIEEKFERHLKIDQEIIDDYVGYKPNVEVEFSGKNHLITFADQEFIAEFCTHISIGSFGEPPCMSYTNDLFLFGSMDEINRSASIRCSCSAYVTAHLVNKEKIHFSCHHSVVEILFTAIRAAHRKAMI